MLSVLSNLPALEISWSVVKRAVLAGITQGARIHPNNSNQAERIRNLHVNPDRRDSWVGVSGRQTREWLEQGYRSDSLKVKTPSPYERSYKTRWNDWDGDPDLGRAVAGFDRYMFGRSKYQAKPALTVNVEFYFSGVLPHATIEQFGGWLAQLFTALEQRGFSLAVNIVAGLYNSGHGDPHRVELRVKSHGERADYTDWSALFSPAGYRVIFFSAICKAAEIHKFRLSSSYGGPHGSHPMVDYNKDEQALFISAGNQTFDNARMDTLLKSTGLIA